MREWLVLLVTDDQAIIDLITKAGERIGGEVEVYRESYRALLALYENPWRPDLLIVDEEMSDLPGSFIADRLLRMREMAEVMVLVPGRNAGLHTKDRLSGVGSIVAKPLLLKENVSFVSDCVRLN
jgi:DNA-binding response OmpR family regulator